MKHLTSIAVLVALPLLPIAAADQATTQTQLPQWQDMFNGKDLTGWVNINESSNYWEAHLPFGGRAGSDSGIGRVGGPHVMHSFTELQTVVLTPSGRTDAPPTAPAA